MLSRIADEQNSLFGIESVQQGITDGFLVVVDEDFYTSKETLEAELNRSIFKVEKIEGSYYVSKQNLKALLRNGDVSAVGDLYWTSRKVEEGLQQGTIQVCALCKKLEWTSKMTAVFDNYGNVSWACRKCIGTKCIRCSNCGEYHLKKYMTNVDGDYWFCETCKTRCAQRCPKCGKWSVREFVGVIVPGREDESITRWCPDCVSEHAIVCPTCNRLFDKDFASSNGECPVCSGDYSRMTFHQYGYKPNAKFFGVNPDRGIDGSEDPDTIRHTLFAGIELEMDNGNRNDLIANICNLREIYCKRDGSLTDESGTECVSHPCTLDHHINSPLWTVLTQKAIANGMKSHDATKSCGLHLHLSRAPFEAAGIEDYPTLIAYGFERFWTEWKIFSRRIGRNGSSLEIDRWAGSRGTSDFNQLKRIIDGQNQTNDHHDCRYINVNVTPLRTVEIRIFKGTLKIETIKATIWATMNFAQRIINGFDPRTVSSFRELFDEDAPDFFTEYLAKREL